ncbi:hypothetical protein [Marinobacter sp. X15-166B]|uniref:hypothetical protein n=1 Tax=Marinobacter sp. X15-166B TaxID=1897620 RepID=UPI00085C7B44|nr:hypothetical protein [Marinobacter sp. X15-166B]OEY66808.1 hypothetical protein BG841_10310 [Marinobacter sp. X15-166B]
MTTPTATEMLAKYLAAEAAVLQGREFQFEGRRVSMSDLPDIIRGRKEWEQRVNAERSRASRAPTIGGLGFSVARLD